MFCSASYYLTRSQDIDDVVQRFKEISIPVMAQQPGYKGIDILSKSNTTENTSELAVLKFWDTEASAMLWTKTKRQFNSGITPLLIGNGTHHYYVVQVRTVK